MRVIYKNLVRTIFAHPKENAVLLLNTVLCTATVFILLQNFYYLKNHFDLIYSDDIIAQHYYINLSDDDYQSKLNDMVNLSPMYYVGEEVEEEISNNSYLSLYYYGFSSIPVNAFSENDKFENFAFIDENIIQVNQTTGSDFESSFVNLMFVSNNFSEVFNVHLLKGRDFNSTDVITNVTLEPIPVILGNDYASVFNVGDIIELENDKLEVIGILDDNAYVSSDGFVSYLDDVIVSLCDLPRDLSVNMDDYDYRKLYTYDYLYCSDTSVDVQKEINRITTECGYYTFELQPIDGVEITETKNISEKNMMLIGLLAFVACVICTMSLSSVLYNRVLQDRAVFCIFLCSGIPLWKINISIVLEMIIMLVLSFFPTWALSIIEYGTLMVPVWQLILFEGIIVLISLVPVFRLNRQVNIDLMIRDRIL